MPVDCRHENQSETTMRLPDFLGIGAQRAATTWVHQCLREHPQIFVPPCKEVHFFNDNYDKGLSWYASHFCPKPGQRCVGEITPHYLDHELAAPRMARDVPNALLFAILRDPVERAFSAYRFYQHLYGNVSFAEVYRNSNLIEPGRYAKHLKHLFDYYAKDRVKIFFYEEVIQEPLRMLADLFGFLGVEPSFVPLSLHIIFNHGSGRRAQSTLGTLYRTASSFIKMRFVMRQLRRWCGPRSRTSQCEAIPERIREDLRELFHDEVLQLQQLTGRDCSAWLSPRKCSPTPVPQECELQR